MTIQEAIRANNVREVKRASKNYSYAVGEMKEHGEWMIDSILADDWELVPDPIECWINVYPDGSMVAWNTEEEARGVSVLGGGSYRTVRAREVRP